MQYGQLKYRLYSLSQSRVITQSQSEAVRMHLWLTLHTCDGDTLIINWNYNFTMVRGIGTRLVLPE